MTQKTPRLISCYHPVNKRPIFVSTIYRSVHAHAICGTLRWVTQDMFMSSERILWQVPCLFPAATAAAAIHPQFLTGLACTNVATC
jgi:hypothetical protein